MTAPLPIELFFEELVTIYRVILELRVLGFAPLMMDGLEAKVDEWAELAARNNTQLLERYQFKKTTLQEASPKPPHNKPDQCWAAAQKDSENTIRIIIRAIESIAKASDRLNDQAHIEFNIKETSVYEYLMQVVSDIQEHLQDAATDEDEISKSLVKELFGDDKLKEEIL